MYHIIPLEQIMMADYQPSHPICWHPHKTWIELQRVIAGIMFQLAEPIDKPWVLAFDSAFYFAAALLACWQKGITPIVAPDTQPGTLHQLDPVIAGLITDRQIEEINAVVLQPTSRENLPLWVERAPQDRALELYTSGSTGTRMRVPKTFEQITTELRALHHLWASRTHGTPRFATVSPMHIYGLWFRLLWPLCTGDVFVDRSGFYWEEILGRLPGGAATIISSPTHLRHLPQAAKLYQHDWQHMVIFSSGGPLARETALHIADICGQAPIEVLGSTETGGIAFRQQSLASDRPWCPLPGVETRVQNGLLAVRSPFLADPTAWWHTGDRAAPIEQQQFQLLGRTDRIVKLSEKRISLTAIERALLRHEAVDDARIILLPPQPGFERSQLAAVIVLTQQGRQWLKKSGTFSVIRELRRHLLHDFERVTLPRLWRFPEALPYNTQGKVIADELCALFQKFSEPEPTEPVVLSTEATEAGCLFQYRVPENLYYFRGHFPQIAVVPGVTQLRWVIQSIETYCGKPIHITAMEALKFRRMLFPGQSFFLEICFDRRGSKWTYRIFSGEQTIASGRLRVRS